MNQQEREEMIHRGGERIYLLLQEGHSVEDAVMINYNCMKRERQELKEKNKSKNDES
ncbi:hypothetical protein [Egbenema bharatensis]|uniref:hypothetical protein n=1 Tax=Egbenema bharatensis TaxID=3463334 RepID=UPI003A8AD39E